MGLNLNAAGTGGNVNISSVKNTTKGPLGTSAALPQAGVNNGAVSTPTLNTTVQTAQAPKAPVQAAPPPQAAPTEGVIPEKGYLANLYEQFRAGTDPYYNYMQQRGTESLNNQFAARGGYNSGAALRGISDFNANLQGQRFDKYADLAAMASGEERNKFLDMWNRSEGVADRKLDTTGRYAPKQGEALDDSRRAAIQLELDKAGVDAATQNQILSNMFSTLGAGAQIYGGLK